MPRNPPIPHEITELLHRWKEGDREAFQQVVTKLSQVRGASLKDRSHFYAFAAQLMRMILIDYSRQAKALKRPYSAGTGAAS